ncbi:hypothetical protein JL721_11547 [Aureococcus anophagefferens]|nr:hypothetical protein JL721_11547 [Aureococcus anophagefferens]
MLPAASARATLPRHPVVLRQEVLLDPAGGGLGNSINAMDAATGERVEDIGFFDITQDINHLQLVEHDTRGFRRAA